MSLQLLNIVASTTLGFEPELTAWLAALPDAAPSAVALSALNDAIVLIKRAGLWSNLKLFGALSNTLGNSMVDIVNPSLVYTPHGAIASGDGFVPYTGIQGNGSDSWINTNADPTLIGLTINNFGMGIQVANGISENTSALGTIQGGTSIGITPLKGNSMVASIGAAAGTTNGAQGTAIGWKSFISYGTNSTDGSNGLFDVSGLITPFIGLGTHMPSGNTISLLRPAPNSGSFSNAQIGCWMFFSGLRTAAQLEVFHKASLLYFQGIGTYVPPPTPVQPVGIAFVESAINSTNPPPPFVWIAYSQVPSANDSTSYGHYPANYCWSRAINFNSSTQTQLAAMDFQVMDRVYPPFTTSGQGGKRPNDVQGPLVNQNGFQCGGLDTDVRLCVRGNLGKNMRSLGYLPRNDPDGIAGATVAAGGSGYAQFDLITCTNGAVLLVLTVSGGAVQAAIVVTQPSTTPGGAVGQSSTTGSGHSATFDFVYQMGYLDAFDQPWCDLVTGITFDCSGFDAALITTPLLASENLAIDTGDVVITRAQLESDPVRYCGTNAPPGSGSFQVFVNGIVFAAGRLVDVTPATPVWFGMDTEADDNRNADMFLCGIVSLSIAAQFKGYKTLASPDKYTASGILLWNHASPGGGWQTAGIWARYTDMILIPVDYTTVDGSGDPSSYLDTQTGYYADPTTGVVPYSKLGIVLEVGVGALMVSPQTADLARQYMIAKGMGAALIVPDFSPIGGQSIAATGSILGNVLTITASTPPSAQLIAAGMYVATPAAALGTKIVSQLTGTPGGIGTYQLSNSQTVSSTSMLIAYAWNAVISAFTDAPISQ